MYAVFTDGSRQYRVSEGDLVKVDFRDVAEGAGVTVCGRDEGRLASTEERLRSAGAVADPGPLQGGEHDDQGHDAGTEGRRPAPRDGRRQQQHRRRR